MNAADTIWTVDLLARHVGGSVVGDGSVIIAGVGGVDTADDGDLVFAESAKYLDAAIRSRAVAIITTAEFIKPCAKPIITVEHPRLAFLKALDAFAPKANLPAGVHPSATVGAGLQAGEAVHIGASATVGTQVSLGNRVVIMAGAVVGDGCVLGDDTILYPNVVLYPGVCIGSRCLIHAGTVIGSDGFGYAQVGQVLHKIPHIGHVRIEDDVEIGANCCIDRAKTDETVIGSGTKIDNLVHIAHNVRIGRSCLLVSQVGIAGTTKLGDGVILAGQVGVVDHVNIGDGAQVGAQSGIRYDVPAGAKFFGSPAVPLTQRMRDIATSARLPETLKQIRSIEKRLKELEATLLALDPSGTAAVQNAVETGYDSESDGDVGPVG